MKSISLLWKILLSTSIAITLLLAITGWFLQDQMLRAMTKTVENEMEVSAQAYEALWHSRAANLRSVSLVLSSMSDVRAAFSTHDEATIRDTAGEMWSKISQTAGVFLVTDPNGSVIASLGGAHELGNDIPAVREAARTFPAQASGFVWQNGKLYQMAVTPVYVASSQGPGLLNVLVAGFAVDGAVAEQLKKETGKSDFVFTSGDGTVASTLPQPLTQHLIDLSHSVNGFGTVHTDAGDFGVIRSRLRNIAGSGAGDLLIIRSFNSVRDGLNALKTKLVLIWIAAILGALAISFWLARRILQPVHRLDEAATEIASQNYGVRVPVTSSDELGRLASTFNNMCASIQQARADLITRERISTIGQLSTSIVHDLRNPLAAIYGGAELLMDSEWNHAQTQRLAANIYRSSRVIKDMLQELSDISRGRAQPAEVCNLFEVIEAAADASASVAQLQQVIVKNCVPSHIEIPLERARMERVFLNLIGNAMEAMPNGGALTFRAVLDDGQIVISVEDSGAGIPAEIRDTLFQPFATAGKKNGLGLGLALSRESVHAHGGDLWLDPDFSAGTRFCMRLPVGAILRI